MNEIKCPYDLNQFILGEPIFENPFPEEECEQRKFYGDCSHCFSTAIASRDHQLNDDVLDKIRAEIDNVLSDGMIHKQTVLGIIDKYKTESGRKAVTEQNIGSSSYVDGTFIISAEEPVESEDKE